MRFDDRYDAGRQLAESLRPYAGAHPIVFGLARGGVPVASEVARVLDAPLDVLVVRKLGAPDQPEFGFGAIGPGNVRVLNDDAVRALGLSSSDIESVELDERDELERRLSEYRGGEALPDLTGRTAILVDDGIATGVSAHAAVVALRGRNPARIVLATPVCAPESAHELLGEVHDFVCLESPTFFRAVGLWYNRFDATSDDEVKGLLARGRRPDDSREVRH